jgi:type II secretory pathway component PulK
MPTVPPSVCTAPYRRRGAVLVLVLIVFSGLSLLAFGLCQRVRLDLRMSRMRGDEMRAYYLALGGVNRCVLALKKDMAENDGKVVHHGQKWYLNTTAAAEGLFADMPDVADPGLTLSYVTSDEASRLSISRSSPAGWLALGGMTEDIQASIVDWEDEDDSPMPRGAESADYLRQPCPYQAKNAPMRSIFELAYIMHVSPSALFGEDGNGNGLLDASEDDGSASGPVDNADGRLDHGLIDFFTIYGDKEVNLNTASPEVMMALPLVQDQARAVEALVSYRLGPDRLADTADDRVFESTDDLDKVQDMDPLAKERLKADFAVVTSQYFRIVSVASVDPDRVRVRLWGFVNRTGGEAKLVFLTRF